MVAICDPAGAPVADELGDPTVHADALELIADPAVDAVVVASPAATHEPYALACIAAGKPVLCEKPLATSAAAALRIVEAERAAGRRLVTVGFMRRYDPGYVDLKARLDAGEIGAPLLVHCAHRNVSVHEFFDSAMIITDSAVHEIDVARWLLDDEIVRVTVLAPRPSRRAREGLRDPQLRPARDRRRAGSSTSRRSSARATPTTSAARSWGRTARSSCSGPPRSRPVRGCPSGCRSPPGFQQRFATAYVNELRAWVARRAAGAERLGRLRRRRGVRGRRSRRSRPARPVDVRQA